MNRVAVTRETLPVNAQSLPDSWMEKLFAIMEDRYGDLWANRYGAFPRQRVMNTWARDLADMTNDELARGVDACRDIRFPPTCPEFRQLCRPALDYERAFIEAVEQMRMRDRGEDRWSHPAVFWAARSLGCDLQNYPYQQMSKRWAAALENAVSRIKLRELPNEVPPRLDALPPPGRTTITAEKAAENLERMKSMLAGARILAGGVGAAGACHTDA